MASNDGSLRADRSRKLNSGELVETALDEVSGRVEVVAVGPGLRVDELIFYGSAVA
jgi:hypothetical protein